MSCKVSTEKPDEKRNERAVWMVIPCSPALAELISQPIAPNHPSNSSLKRGETTLVQRPKILVSRRTFVSSGLDDQQILTLCKLTSRYFDVFSMTSFVLSYSETGVEQ